MTDAPDHDPGDAGPFGQLLFDLDDLLTRDPKSRPMRHAVAESCRALDAAGHLDPADAAAVVMALTLADSIDEATTPGRRLDAAKLAGTIGKLREVMRDLRPASETVSYGRNRAGGVQVGLDELSAPLGDASDYHPSDVGPPD